MKKSFLFVPFFALALGSCTLSNVYSNGNGETSNNQGFTYSYEGSTMEKAISIDRAVEMMNEAGDGNIVAVDRLFFIYGTFNSGTTYNEDKMIWKGTATSGANTLNITGAYLDDDDAKVVSEDGDLDGASFIVQGLMRLNNGKYEVGYVPKAASPFGEESYGYLVKVTVDSDSSNSDDQGGGSQGGGSTITTSYADVLAACKALGEGETSTDSYTFDATVSDSFDPKESSQTAGTYSFNIYGETGDEEMVVWYISGPALPDKGDELTINAKLQHYVDKNSNHKYEVVEGSFTIKSSGGSQGDDDQSGGSSGVLSDLTKFATIDFTTIEAKAGAGDNSRLSNDELKSLFISNCSSSNTISDATGENVYQGYIPGSNDTSAYKDGVDGCIRTGGSKKTGTIVITASQSVKGIKINAHAWTVKDTFTDTISVNDSDAVTMTLEYADYEFTFTGSTTVTITTTNRAFISSIELYK